MEVEVDRLYSWVYDKNRTPPELEFTEGPARRLADHIVMLESRIAALEGEGVIPEADEDAQWVWSLAHQLSRFSVARLEGEEALIRLLRIYRKLTPPADAKEEQ